MLLDQENDGVVNVLDAIREIRKNEFIMEFPESK